MKLFSTKANDAHPLDMSKLHYINPLDDPTCFLSFVDLKEMGFFDLIMDYTGSVKILCETHDPEKDPMWAMELADHYPEEVLASLEPKTSNHIISNNSKSTINFLIDPTDRHRLESI